MRVRSVSIFFVAVLTCGLWSGSAQARVYVPGVKIVFEVRTPEGALRSYHRPGLSPTYWDQSFPALRGDRVTVDALVATGGAELNEVQFNLDGAEVTKLTKAPWRTEMNTASLAPGDHTVTVKATTAAPHSRDTSASTLLVIVPSDERRVNLTADGGESEQERLSSVIGSLNPELDEALDANATITLTKPELFYASAGPAAQEFFYTLSREGKVFYTSPLLPLNTFIYLEPAVQAPATPVKTEQPKVMPPAKDSAFVVGQPLAPGEVTLTLQVGDGIGHFGPPVWATLVIASQSDSVQPEEVKP